MSRRPPHQNTRHQYAPRLRARACMGVVAVVLLVCVTCPSSATFTVYWNSPTQTCHQFGVHINVSIFYGPGAFPYLKDDQPVNGGIPQNGSLQDHLHAFTSRVQQQLPTDFSAMSPPPYHEASRAWVAAHYPHLPPSKVFFLAEQTFNESAREYHDSASFLSPLDTVNTMGFTKMLGLEGAVVWGSTSDVATKSECLILKVSGNQTKRNLG
ncbi:Hyaluronidase-like [Homarus americanus]|uniref:Hyaluronidase n=1 Tax=Homarus americanus TaxID=6706 RepID=A0A8J5MWC2_HOMAM|nr:Hyaluronidase-like [Homarus americanus]